MKSLPVIATLLLLGSVSLPAQYDLLLKGGHLIDAKNEINGAMDVAIQGGRIAAVETDIPASKATKVVDVSGLYGDSGAHRHPCTRVCGDRDEGRLLG